MINRVTSTAAGLKLACLMFACATAFSLGCGGDEAADAPPSVDVTGVWNGTGTGDTDGKVSLIALTVKQMGAGVTGTGTVGADTVTVSGKVSGKEWTGSLTAAKGAATFSLAVEGNSATGKGTDGKGVGTVKLTR